MTKQNKKIAFEDAVAAMQLAFGISQDEAVKRVQDQYRDFYELNERRIEKQDDNANHASTDLNNQIVLIATATLTFSGAFIGIVYKTITVEHAILLFLIIIAELLALSFTLFDYRSTINFHNIWAKTYNKLMEEINRKIDKGKIQFLSEMNDIAVEHTKTIDKESSQLVKNHGILLTLVGAWTFFILIFAYFIDIPAYNGHCLNQNETCIVS